MEQSGDGLNNFSVVKNVIPHDFCDYIRTTFKSKALYTPRGPWKAYTVKKGEYYDYIVLNVSAYIPDNYTISWINITQYNTNDSLRMHNDEKSQRTIVCDISEPYIGGSFRLHNNTYINTTKGDIIIFDGSNVLHGVDKVTHGERVSLNLWTHKIMTNI